jgi:hypothetical protein
MQFLTSSIFPNLFPSFSIISDRARFSFFSSGFDSDNLYNAHAAKYRIHATHFSVFVIQLLACNCDNDSPNFELVRL